MPKFLTQQQVDEYREQGFLALQAYMPAGAAQTIGENLWLPIRGNCTHPEMIRLRRPKNDLDADAMAERAQVNRNYSDILYRGASRKRAY